MLRDRLVVTHHMVRLCWGGPLIKQVRPASSAGHKPAGACHLCARRPGPRLATTLTAWQGYPPPSWPPATSAGGKRQKP